MSYTRNKRVKTHWLYWSKTATSGESLATFVADNWAASDDIWVIGVSLQLECGQVGINGDGETAISGEISRAGVGLSDGCLMRLSHSRYEEATAGAHAIPELFVQQNVIFPEGCGVEVDEGEYLNLLVSTLNNVAFDRTFKAEGLIYYIEK